MICNKGVAREVLHDKVSMELGIPFEDYEKGYMGILFSSMLVAHTHIHISYKI